MNNNTSQQKNAFCRNFVYCAHGLNQSLCLLSRTTWNRRKQNRVNIFKLQINGFKMNNNNRHLTGLCRFLEKSCGALLKTIVVFKGDPGTEKEKYLKQHARPFGILSSLRIVCVISSRSKGTSAHLYTGMTTALANTNAGLRHLYRNASWRPPDFKHKTNTKESTTRMFNV